MCANMDRAADPSPNMVTERGPFFIALSPSSTSHTSTIIVLSALQSIHRDIGTSVRSGVLIFLKGHYSCW